MSDEQLDELIETTEKAPAFLGDRPAILNALRELKALRQEIARWEALPPRITGTVIRPVFPIQESDYPIDERGEN